MAEETDKESNQEEVHHHHHHQQPMSSSSLEGTNGSSSIESIPQATSHSDSYYSSDIGSTEHLVVVLEAETSFGGKHDPITQFITHNNNNIGGKGGFLTGTSDEAIFPTQIVAVGGGGHRGMMHRGSLTNGTTSPTESSAVGVASGSGDQGVGSGDGTRRHSKSSSLPHGVKLCPENREGQSKTVGGAGALLAGEDGVGLRQKKASSSSSVSDENMADRDSSMSGDRWASLEEELRKAQSELKAKNAEVEQLKGIREQVEGELEDLTASLFQEAHKMVKEAKMKEVSSEKSLKEAKMQLEGLQAEVAALKTLLITSTPARPNLGSSSNNGTTGGNGISLFKKQHKRCPSHNHLNYGRPSEDETDAAQKQKEKTNEVVIDRSRCDVDPIMLAHFAAWRAEPVLLREKSDFLDKMYVEEIDPCLTFANEALVTRLRKAIEDNSIWLEPVSEKDRTNVPKQCALLSCPKICHYRMRFAFDSDEWFDISRFCRDRIAAVCEFLNYLRYIKNGLVKASVDDAYWEILRLRKQMALAKLGIAIS